MLEPLSEAAVKTCGMTEPPAPAQTADVMQPEVWERLLAAMGTVVGDVVEEGVPARLHEAILWGTAPDEADVARRAGRVVWHERAPPRHLLVACTLLTGCMHITYWLHAGTSVLPHVPLACACL